ncbi:MAG: hypothetical protein Q4F29_01120 [Lachnospiraceae bacterium]|nr:hypothetical protein [Lachnospiraceae bacterium]
MRVWKKLTAVMLSALLAGAMAVPAFAAEERTKIEKVSLSFTAYDDGEDTEYGEVEVSTGSGTYDVDDVEFLSNTSTSRYPRVKVTLIADGDYYFGGSSRSFFDLEGEGAYYSSSSLRDSRSTLVVTVQLKDYSGAEADVAEDVEWDYEGSGTWSEVYNAGYYEVRLKKGSTVISDILKVDDTTFNFCNMITQTGNYSFQVRTVNKYVTSNKSKWVSSERWSVDSDTLQYIRQNAANGVYNNYYGGSDNSYSSTNTSGPAGASTGWQLNAIGYWYRNYDGTWPAACWQQINGAWYYFNQDGYMVANNWIHHTDGNWYYLGGDGKMLTNTRTPDNYYVDGYGIYRPGL